MRGPPQSVALPQLTAVAKLGLVVVVTFAAVWAPLFAVGAAPDALQRLFPVHRGLFEDYVANFWCVSSLALKWKRLLSQRQLVWLCLLCTLGGMLPSTAAQVLRPTNRGLVLCLANTALSFFFFSYQVRVSPRAALWHVRQ